MDKTKRPVVIAGNWKMNNTPSASREFVRQLIPRLSQMNGCTVVLCVPFVDLTPVGELIYGTNLKLGAQNVHWEASGAFTGEISADMLRECGTEYVVIGHSERRQYFGEVDTTVNRRVQAALRGGLKPIICVGELLAEREEGITAEILAMQTKIALRDVPAAELEKIIIAYEPVWAIGTGRTATAAQADEGCGLIRSVVGGIYGADAAAALCVQYGGSMNAKNAAELLSQYNVDGGLIGGASLKADDFTEIVRAAQ